MEPLDYWRLNDELTVVQAALLVVGADPSHNMPYLEDQEPHKYPDGYAAALSALQLAIIGDRLMATTVRLNLDYQHPDVAHPIRAFDWYATSVSVADLKLWLHSRGMRTGFFFPEGPVTVDYLDKNSASFAPKLAAAVQAWTAVRADRVDRPSGKSVKSDLTRWLNLHAAEYGLTNDDGEPNKLAVEEVSKVANWDSKGGAPKTPGN